MSWGVSFSRLGEPFSLGWHRILRFVIARGGGCDYMRLVIASLDVLGVMG